MEVMADKASPFQVADNHMDAAALFIALSADPVVIDTNAISLRGGLVPVIMPLAGLPTTTRARLLLSHEQLPLEIRVAAALDAGEIQPAWDLVIRKGGIARRNPQLNLVLNNWAAKELARLKLAAGRETIVIISSTEKKSQSFNAAIAYSTVQQTLSGIVWPNWSGNLLVIVGDVGDRDPYPGIATHVRPALPMVRMSENTPGSTQDEILCVRITEMALALVAPPVNGWPKWLTVGLNEVVKAKMRGEGPSPLQMLSIRQQAGLIHLQQLLENDQPDASLAMALCAPLVHTRRRHLLGNLLDLIRGGAASEGAIRVAYGLTLTKLLEER